MLSKFTDFLSSIGMMLVGVFLLFFSSVYFASDHHFSFAQLPTSGKRSNVGGDIVLENLPPSKPSVPLLKAGTNVCGMWRLSGPLILLLILWFETLGLEKKNLLSS